MTPHTFDRHRRRLRHRAMAIRLFAGCYERFLFGFEFSPDDGSLDQGGPPTTLDRKYTFAAHKVCIDRVEDDGIPHHHHAYHAFCMSACAVHFGTELPLSPQMAPTCMPCPLASSQPQPPHTALSQVRGWSGCLPRLGRR